MILRIIIILFLTLTLTNCSSDNEALLDQYGNIINENGDIIECAPNPGCPSPFINQSSFYFQLIDSNDQIIELNENNITGINWILEGSQLNQQLTFDITENIGRVELTEQAFKLIETQNYILNSNFGSSQLIQVKLNRKALFEDKCNPCSEYFISSINQNNREVIFQGELTSNDIIINIRIQ